jgi:hypothetical protein
VVKLSIRTALAAIAIAMLLIAAPAFAITSVHEDQLTIADLGYVASGDSLEYTHFFEPATDPGIAISSIDGAWLEVGIFDDSQCRRLRSCANDWLFESEVASIDLNSVEWQTGQATAHVFFGNITAQANLLVNNGLLDVSITSEHGDFTVVWSTLTTRYTWDVAGGGGSGSPMPEPSAALVFAIGALVMQRRVRKSWMS